MAHIVPPGKSQRYAAKHGPTGPPDPYPELHNPTGVVGRRARDFEVNEQLLRRGYGPGALAGQTNQLFQMLQSSPQWAQMLSQIFKTGQGTSNAINQRLSSANAGTTGVGAVSGGIAQGIPGQMAIGAQGDLFRQALEAAIQNLMARLGAQQPVPQNYAQDNSVLQGLAQVARR